MADLPKDLAELDPGDVTLDQEDAPDLEPTRCLPPPGPTPPGGRWALSTFHFNVQYVAGGLIGFDRIALNLP